MNPVRDLLKSGKTVVGTAGSLYEDNMAMLADSGLDFILFDSQHAPVEVKQYQRAIQAMRGKKAAPIVRVSANRVDVICFALDLGARGIIVPMVNTKQEAEAMVRACLYAPLGERSNAGVRGEWGATTDYRAYLDTVNAELLIIPMIETQQAIANLDAILSVGRIDVLLVGPSDLSIELGVPLQYASDPYQAGLDTIAAACKHTGSSRACTSSRRTWTPMSSSQRGSSSSRCPGHDGRWKASRTVLAASRGTDDALPNATDGTGTEYQPCHPCASRFVVTSEKALATTWGMTLTDLPACAVHTITSGTEAEAVAHVQARGALVQARAPLLRMSSLHDLEHRRPLEIEETLGYVVTQAATMGLAVPTVDTCYRLMRGLNRCMQRASGSPCWRCGAEGISQGMGPTPSKVRSCLPAASSGGAPSASGSSVLFTSRILLKHIAQDWCTMALTYNAPPLSARIPMT